jgi:hypothetical protein
VWRRRTERESIVDPTGMVSTEVLVCGSFAWSRTNVPATDFIATLSRPLLPPPNSNSKVDGGAIIGGGNLGP